MLDNKNMYIVKNRSAGRVIYNIKEMNIRREFGIGEEKKVSGEELEQLSYIPGGKELLANFLQIKDAGLLSDLGINVEPEYNMSEVDIVKLINEGSLDEFLDFLDFAPVGNIDIMKRLAVELPMSDFQKRQAVKNKTGFDVDTAVKNKQLDEATEEAAAPATQRRVQPAETAPAGRRTSGSKYTILNK